MSLRDWLRPYVELKRVIVNLKTGTVFRGVAYAHKGPWLVLRSVEILEDRGTAVKANLPVMDGEVLVANYEIDFIQVLR